MVDLLCLWDEVSSGFSNVVVLNCLMHACMFMHAKLLHSSPTLWDPMGPTRLFCPWDSLGANTGVGCSALLRGIFSTQRSNPHPYVSWIGRWVFLPLPGKLSLIVIIFVHHWFRQGALRKGQTFFLNITEFMEKTISSKCSPPCK